MYSFICLVSTIIFLCSQSVQRNQSILVLSVLCSEVQTEAISLGNPTKCRNVGGMPSPNFHPEGKDCGLECSLLGLNCTVLGEVDEAYVVTLNRTM